MNEDEIKQIKEWREADKAYETLLRAMAMRAKQELAVGPAGVKSRWSVI